MKRQAQRGVTLVELMVVLAIVGVLAGLATGASPSAGGSNPQAASDQIAATLSYAHTRAASTRRIHRVQLEPDRMTVWQSSQTGLATPTLWQVVQTVQVPKGNMIWNAQSGVQVNAGASPAQNASLAYSIDFRPDGVATGSTIFVTDKRQSKKYRVLVYRATGGSYAREQW